jgi:hypothetical protein
MAAWVAASGIAACRSEEHREVSRDVAQVAFAVNQLREAPHDAKEAPLATLLALPCRFPPACELQQVCASAYQVHIDAVQVGLRARQHHSTAAPDPDLVVRLLQQAETQLAHAKAGAERCVQLQGELTREYKL